ncbi:MAG: NUDIX hydrolase [Burkholderiales bacterium]|nr:NUDIX hydrolase [Burkholderiales bacterium]
MSDERAPGASDFTETRIDSRTVYHGKLLHVLEDRARLPDGGEATREYIRHPGAAMIIALLDEETIVLERQFRYPLGRHFIELPAGKIDPGEEPLATAKRELAEECGYAAAHWRHLATLHPCIGYSDERMELYLARDLTPVGRRLDEEEFLEVLEVKAADALEWVREGKITEVKAVVGLLWLDRIRKGEKRW